MNEEPVLEQVGAQLLQQLRQAMHPGVLLSPDDAALARPGGTRKDFRFGIFLYDIRDSSPFGAPAPVRISAAERRMPPKTVDLCYLLFVNHSVPFDGMEADEEARLLEAAMRIVHDGLRFQAGALEAAVAFESMALSEKLALWQSLSCPVQPAVYLYVAPVCIPSGRIVHTPTVRTTEYRVEKKEVSK